MPCLGLSCVTPARRESFRTSRRRRRSPTAPTPVGPPKPGTDGLTFADVGRVELDEREVVVRAGVRIGLAVGLHGQPRAVGQGAWPRRARRPRPRCRAAVRPRGSRRCPWPPRAGAVRCLSDVDVLPAVKMKLAVHWPPSVKVCTPGWTVAWPPAPTPTLLGAIAAAATTVTAAIVRARFWNYVSGIPRRAESYA